jgi:hypothetical protein
MSRPFPQRQYLFPTSLLLALVLHLVFLSVFVFTFPKRFEESKPQLISLGSILDWHDVEIIPRHSSGFTAETKGLPENGIAKFVYEFFEMTQNPSRKTDVPKPIFTEKTLSPEEKMSVKPTFDQGELQPEISDGVDVDDGIPPYRPLRFSPYD